MKNRSDEAHKLVVDPIASVVVSGEGPTEAVLHADSVRWHCQDGKRGLTGQDAFVWS